MSLFDILSGPDINAGVEEFRNTEGAVLLDVRDPGEYRKGHVPGSINIPVSRISEAEDAIKDKEASVFVYCYSGARSDRARSNLMMMGYRHVKNIGGIKRYRGELEK